MRWFANLRFLNVLSRNFQRTVNIATLNRLIRLVEQMPDDKEDLVSEDYRDSLYCFASVFFSAVHMEHISLHVCFN